MTARRQVPGSAQRLFVAKVGIGGQKGPDMTQYNFSKSPPNSNMLHGAYHKRSTIGITSLSTDSRSVAKTKEQLHGPSGLAVITSADTTDTSE